MRNDNSNTINGLNIVEGSMIVTLPWQISPEIIDSIKKDLFDTIVSSEHKLKGVIFDFAALKIMDSIEYSSLYNLVRAVKVLGYQSVIVGFQPGVVSALIDMNVTTDDLTTFRNIDQGLAYLNSSIMNENDEEEEDAIEEDNLEICDKDIDEYS